MKTTRLLLLALAACATCSAVDTRFWQQGDRSDFERGTLNHLSLRADGRIFLAPEFTEVFDSTTPYLWTLAADSKGNSVRCRRRLRQRVGESFRYRSQRQKPDVRRAGWPGNSRHWRSTQGRALRRYRSRRQGLQNRIRRQAEAVLRSSPEIHLGHGVLQQRRSVCRHRRSGRDSSRDARWRRFRLLQDRRDPRPVARHRRARQPDRRNRAERVDPAHLASGPGLRAVPSAEARDYRGGSHARRRHLRGSGVGNKTAVVQAAPPPPTSRSRRLHPGHPPSAMPGSRPYRWLPGPSLAGGSEVYRINPDGSPRKIWSSAQDVVYAIGFDAGGSAACSEPEIAARSIAWIPTP